VLAVNIKTIEWTRLIKASRKDLLARQAKWGKEQREDNDESEDDRKNNLKEMLENVIRTFSLTKFDIVANFFALLCNFHWIIYWPICAVVYWTPIGEIIRSFIIASAVDEVCFYLEQKGMEMEIRLLEARNQAAFMLSALREIRADGRELKKKQKETEEEEVGKVLGNLLGPVVKEDKGPAVEPPGFEMPPHYEFVGLELDLPVGFRRLRWAMLHRDSTFITEALWKTESKFESINRGDWNKHNEDIGSPDLPPTASQEDFIGAERESSYLMPKSAFVNANVRMLPKRGVVCGHFINCCTSHYFLLTIRCATRPQKL